MHTLDDNNRSEKSIFQANRIRTLDAEEYLAFHQCRQTNFLSRGKHNFVEWLSLSSTDPEQNKNVELFAYLMRVLLSMIVE